MIKRLASAPTKKTKTSIPLRSKNKKARRIAVRKTSNRVGREEESTLAAEKVFVIYDGVEAGHAKTRTKPVEYPLETEGSRLAAKARAQANDLSETKRAALFNKGMAMIYGNARKKAARARH